MRDTFIFMDDVPVDESKRPVEYKYVELEITKAVGSVIYLEVPKHYDWGDILKKGQKVIKEQGDLIDYNDWEDDYSEYEVQSIKEVPEYEATAYPYGTVD